MTANMRRTQIELNGLRKWKKSTVCEIATPRDKIAV